MNQRSYIHRPCLFLAVMLACGIWLGTQSDVSLNFAALIGVIFVIISVLCRHQRWNIWTLLILFLLLGVMNVSKTRVLPTDHVAHLSYEQRLDIENIEGVIVSDPFTRKTARGEKTSFELSVCRISLGEIWAHRSGKVLVNVFRQEELHYGDRIRLTGKLHKPFQEGFSGRFSYEDYLKRDGMYWILSVKKASTIEIIEREKGSKIRSLLLKLRLSLQSVLDRHLNAFEAGVIQSLVLGGRYYIPERTRELFVQTGTAHILAISGMNVGGMAFLVFLILNVLRLGRRTQIVVTCSVLIIYCFLTGANPSVVRATVMAVVMLAGLLFERQTDTLNSLGLAGLIILFFDPMSLYDIGFQLSFMGVFSIICLYPRIYKLFDPLSANRVVTVLLQALCISFAAWIGVLPLVAFYFQIITPVSILANIPIIPFVSALFMLGCGLILTGWLCPPLTFLFAACIKVILFLLMFIVDFFSKLPFAYLYLPEFSLITVVLYYVVLATVFGFLTRRWGGDRSAENLHFLS